MKIILLFCLFYVSIFADSRYETKYDAIDIDEVLRNERLLNAYVNCLLDRYSCTKDGAELKSK